MPTSVHLAFSKTPTAGFHNSFETTVLTSQMNGSLGYFACSRELNLGGSQHDGSTFRDVVDGFKVCDMPQRPHDGAGEIWLGGERVDRKGQSAPHLVPPLWLVRTRRAFGPTLAQVTNRSLTLSLPHDFRVLRHRLRRLPDVRSLPSALAQGGRPVPPSPFTHHRMCHTPSCSRVAEVMW